LVDQEFSGFRHEAIRQSMGSIHPITSDKIIKSG
jgi:hypothetical protein